MSVYGSPKSRGGAVDGPFVTGGSIPDIEGEEDLSTLTSGLLRIINTPGANSTFASIAPGADNTFLRSSGGVMAFAALPALTVTATQVAYGHSDNTLTTSAELTYATATGTFDVAKSRSGAAVTTKTRNTSNTATSSAQHLIEVAGTSAADAFTTFSISGGAAFSIGIGNASSGDPLIISAGATLPAVASTLGIAINSAGEVGIFGAPVSGRTLNINTAAFNYVNFSTTSISNSALLAIGANSGAQTLNLRGFGSSTGGNTAYGEPQAGLAEISTTSLGRIAILVGGSILKAVVEAAGFAVIPTGILRAYVGGTLKTIQSDQGNITTGEDPLHSYTMGAGMLSADGQSVVVEAIVTFAANGVNKQAKLHFGGTAVGDTGVLTQNGGSVVFRARITRVTATTQRTLCTMTAATHIAPMYTALTETLANAIVIKLTGEGTNTDDLVNKITAVEWRAAQN